MLRLLHQIVEQAAARWPEQSAFRFADQALSYHELDIQSNGLAHCLIEAGTVPGDRIGLLLPKSLQLPVAVYGVLKAGAIVVPIDPQLPVQRLRQLVGSAGIGTLIAAASQADLVARMAGEQRLNSVIGLPASAAAMQCIDWGAIPALDAAPTVTLSTEDPAYLLFTSGSTGTPKGILHSHASALAYATLAADTYGLTTADVLANFAPLHFDQSTFEFYSGPLAGATTVLIPQAFAVAQASLAELLEQARCTVWYSVPSVMVQMLNRQLLDDRDLSALRWVLFGGESFPSHALPALRAAMPNARFSNVYGPTEVNQCTYFHIDNDQWDNQPVPIGEPWADAEYLVVDEQDRPVPEGTRGELLIRSTTAMIGYWQQPDLTRAAFYYPAPDQRFYRTGDLVSHNAAGQLLFHGRRDRQLKARGYRIELDEIEVVLAAHPEVDEVASFVVPAAGDAAATICAAVLPVAATTPQPAMLRKYLAQQLPRYALPDVIEIVATLPRTGTNKIDRQQLVQRFQHAARAP